jgi:uncharacterized protein (DUF885 family)
MIRHRSVVALGALSLAATLLAGCSAVTEGIASGVGDALNPEQSVAEACLAISRPLISVAAEMQSLEQTAQEDPASVGPVFEQASADLTAVSAELENPEVREALDTAIAALDELTVQYSAVLADPENADFVAFEAALNGMESDFAAIDTVCG